MIGLILVVNGMFPGALDPVHVAQDRSGADREADHLAAACSDDCELPASLYGSAAPAVPVQQFHGGDALDGPHVIHLVARGLCPGSRLQIRGRDLILSAIIAVSTFPLVTLLVPLFEIMRALGLLNTWVALILPYTVLSLPVCTLILVSFFEGIPRDLENSAMIDGCTRLGALFKVVVPLSAPGVFTAGILAFVNAWDEFLLALSFNSNPLLRTLPVGITLYQGEFALPLAGDLGRARRRHRAGRQS